MFWFAVEFTKGTTSIPSSAAMNVYVRKGLTTTIASHAWKVQREERAAIGKYVAENHPICLAKYFLKT